MLKRIQIKPIYSKFSYQFFHINVYIHFSTKAPNAASDVEMQMFHIFKEYLNMYKSE